jgi:hypothetical protein
MLSTQVSTVGLRLRHNTLKCGGMLEVSRDAVAAGEQKFVCCTAEQSKIFSICTATLDPLRRFAFHELESLALSCRRRWRC